MQLTPLPTSLMAALTLATTTPAVAQDDSSIHPHPVSIADTEIHALRSAIIDDDFELWVARPQAGFVPLQDGPVGVLYVLDANLFFGTAVEMTRLMHKLCT